MTVSYTYNVEAYLSAAWTSILTDVRTAPPIVFTRGLSGCELADRVADVGTLDFALDNSAGNSGGKLGYYSPDHANLRTGFGIGMKTRLKVIYGGETYYKFYGKVTSAPPLPGQYRERYTSVQAVDFMNELLVHNMALVPVQTGKKGNELLATIVANLPTAPLATSYAAGPDTFAYALHDIQDENTSGMEAAQRVDQSGLSFTFVKGDLTGGETLTWQTRHTRSLAASVASFSDTMTDLVIGYKADNKIYNTVKGKGFPVQVGTVNEVLWSSRKEIVLEADASQTLDMPYTDPTGLGNRIALSPGTGVTPEADTDYKMSSTSGGGNDLNANLTFAVNTWGGNMANVTLTNGAAVTGYINICQLRGKIIRLYDPVIATKTDETSKSAYGDRALTYVLPYQDSINVIDAFAATMLDAKKDPHSDIDSLEFVANKNDTLMKAAMTIDVGSRITIAETVSGISTDFFVNKYSLVFEPGILRCKLENLEALTSTGAIGVWGTDASEATWWGPGTDGVVGNWVF